MTNSIKRWLDWNEGDIDDFIIENYCQFKDIMELNSRDLANVNTTYVLMIDNKYQKDERDFYILKYELTQFQALKMVAWKKCTELNDEQIIDLINFDVVKLNELENFKENIRDMVQTWEAEDEDKDELRMMTC